MLRNSALIISLCAIVRMGKQMRTERVIENLSGILLDEMGKDELTIDEMAQKCGVSKRKLCEVLYREKKGLRLETLITICENAGINYAEVFKF